MKTMKTTTEGKTIIVGVDVGGTNTDAVFFEKQTKEVLKSAKTATTVDVTSGIVNAIKKAWPDAVSTGDVSCLSIGTTCFINAILERSPKLAKVAVLRLCGPATAAIEPFETIPQGLRNVIEGGWKYLDGGFVFTGAEISKFDEGEVLKAVKEFKAAGIKRFVVCGVNSPMNPKHEEAAREIILKEIPDGSVTLSSKVGQLGLIESSGPTNSCRGAFFLTGIENGIVVDIGGTTTDVGALVNGFPRLSQTFVQIGGTRTNFRIPDVQSIALGGGSIIDTGGMKVGPQSVGFQLHEKSKCFGGDVLTATDVCVVRDDLDDIGNPEAIGKLKKELSSEITKEISEKIHEMAKDVVDLLKTSEKKVPVILVGGGVILINDDKFDYVKPKNAGVANAIGAAIANVSGSLNEVVVMKKGNGVEKEDAEYRLEQLDRLRKKVKGMCVANGAKPESVEIVFEDELELGYVGAVSGQKRVVLRAIGEIEKFSKLEEEVAEVKFELEKRGGDSPTCKEADEEVEKFKIGEDYRPNIIDGEWIVNRIDLKCIAIGSGILGCGGGGSTFLGEMIAKKYLGKIKILPVSSMPEDGVVGSVAFMGAPSVLIENVPNGKECISAMKKMEELMGKKLSGLQCLEIGGLNSTTPLYVGGLMGLPIYDCDGMGRAFPELQMCTNFIYGDKFNPTVLSNGDASVYAKTDAKTTKDIEADLRVVVFGKFGGYGGLALPPHSKKELLAHCVMNSYSESWRIGKAVLLARAQNKDPVKSILQMTSGKLLFRGKISELNKRKIKGFDKVVLKMVGYEEFKGESMEIVVQNENLVAKLSGGKVVACVPDIITIVNPDDGEVIQTEALQFGLRCSVLAMPVTSKLKTPEAMEVVGPKGFNLDEGYEYVECAKIDEFKTVFK